MIPSACADSFKRIPDSNKPDLSAVKVVVLGGMMLTSEMRKSLKESFNRFGAAPIILNGYGLSETGGACLLSTENHEDDEVGFPLYGVKVRLYDEEKKLFYKIEDGENIGGLYIHSPAMSDGKLFGEQMHPLEKIDSDNYVCTYDLAKVNKDGSISICGRMNNYFVNNDGIRFDAGLIEDAIIRQEKIDSCVLVPFYNKNIHDTAPALFLKIRDGEGNKAQLAKNALVNVFINEGIFKDSNLPARLVILDNMPLGASGKPSRYALNPRQKFGLRFYVRPMKKDGRLLDIILEPLINEDYSDPSPEGCELPFEKLLSGNLQLKPEDVSPNTIMNLKDITNPMSVLYTPINQKPGARPNIPNFGCGPFANNAFNNKPWQAFMPMWQFFMPPFMRPNCGGNNNPMQSFMPIWQAFMPPFMRPNCGGNNSFPPNPMTQQPMK